MIVDYSFISKRVEVAYSSLGVKVNVDNTEVYVFP